MKHHAKLFGTDGIRCQFGTNYLSRSALITISHAIASWLQQKTKKPTALIIRDTRASGKIISTIISSILSQHDIRVIDAGILPTPAAALLVKQYDATCAIIITASHNPAHDNGIKIISSEGEKITAIDEQYITDYVCAQKDTPHFIPHTKHITQYPQAKQDYIQNLKNKYASTNLTGMHILIDTAHGAFSSIAKTVLSSLGAHVTTINNYPTGTNINHQCGAAQENCFQQLALTYTFDYAFAFDGDGDRLIGIDKHGHIIDGDDFLWILAHHETYHNQPAIVGTIMSNQGLAVALESIHKKLIRVNVGDKYISRELIAQSLLLGGESSGHIIMRDKNTISDGLITLLSFLECAQKYQTLPRYTKYIQKQNRIAYTSIHQEKEQQLKILTQELAARYPDARIIIRPSGTEPVIRIMVEHAQEAIAEQYLQEAHILLKNCLL